MAQSTEPKLPFDARVGTYNNGTRTTGTFFLLLFQFPENSPQQDVPLTVRGPSGWNSNQPFTTTLEQASVDGNWWTIPRTGIAAVSGNYTLEVRVNHQTYSITTALISTERLAQPQVMVVASSPNRVRVNWQAVPGALQYYVTLEDDESVLERAYTSGTSLTFSDLELSPGKTYEVYVEAWNLPYTSSMAYMDMAPQINGSVAWATVNLR
ncbi:MAG TPA: fibronectin type III domain-containing protein [Meiothermus sp.]|nr:fibronectin type III domain-containing protein [Meiothermus sp.]